MVTWSESQQSNRYQFLPRPRADATSRQPDSKCRFTGATEDGGD